MTSIEARPHQPRKGGEHISKADDLVSIGMTTTISVLAVVYTVRPLIVVLVAWEAVAVVYLALDFTTFGNRTTRDVPSRGRPCPERFSSTSPGSFPSPPAVPVSPLLFSS